MVTAVGFGLLFTISPDTAASRLIGFQILAGAGLGSIIQNTVIIAQAEYADNEAPVPQATSLITFMQIIGSAIGLAIAGGVFSSQLRVAPDLPPDVKNAVLSNIEAISSLSASDKVLVKAAYGAAIDRMCRVVVKSAAAAL